MKTTHKYSNNRKAKPCTMQEEILETKNKIFGHEFKLNNSCGSGDSNQSSVPYNITKAPSDYDFTHGLA